MVDMQSGGLPGLSQQQINVNVFCPARPSASTLGRRCYVRNQMIHVTSFEWSLCCCLAYAPSQAYSSVAAAVQ